jgi:SCY1-like protein 1
MNFLGELSVHGSSVCCADFFRKLDAVADDFPADFFKMKVLPELLKSVEFGGGGAKVFGTVMQIAQKLSDDEYETQITPVVVRLFANPDRGIRVCLLDNLPLMIDHLPQKIVNDKIFPQLVGLSNLFIVSHLTLHQVTGFTDVAPVVREQTVKAVLTIVPKLSDRVVNGELLRHLAKTANDEQPGIRTNTTICLGKIARNLGASSRAKVLSAPFVHGRTAALMALAATADLFSEDDCASKLLPIMCPSLVDKEKMIRDQAQKSVDIYITRIRKFAATMPDTVLPPPILNAGGVASPRMGTPANDTSWAGWAISSFTKQLASTSGQIGAGSATNGSTDHRSSSVPPTTIAQRAPQQYPQAQFKTRQRDSRMRPRTSTTTGVVSATVMALAATQTRRLLKRWKTHGAHQWSQSLPLQHRTTTKVSPTLLDG